ncbi:MAG: hypothetical protein LUD78_10055 [Clostridiales bacterium]|nr:hypothetical protein [Clostridiales bacterium]
MIKLNSGDKFGNLTVVGPAPPSEKYPKKRMWQCRCVCGKTVDIPASYLTHGVVTSCGCRRTAARKDITGQRFGKLTAVAPTGKNHSGRTVWLWRCDCGGTVEATASSVQSGRTSCGCGKKRTEKENIENAHAAVPLVDGTNLSLIKPGVQYKSNTSGYKGVSWHKRQGKWQARITVKGKTIHLGYYAKVEDAAKARARAEGDYFEPIIEAHKKED